MSFSGGEGEEEGEEEEGDEEGEEEEEEEEDELDPRLNPVDLVFDACACRAGAWPGRALPCT